MTTFALVAWTKDYLDAVETEHRRQSKLPICNDPKPLSFWFAQGYAPRKEIQPAAIDHTGEPWYTFRQVESMI